MARLEEARQTCPYVAFELSILSLPLVVAHVSSSVQSETETGSEEPRPH
jgi:hypothetical protein